MFKDMSRTALAVNLSAEECAQLERWVVGIGNAPADCVAVSTGLGGKGWTGGSGDRFW